MRIKDWLIIALCLILGGAFLTGASTRTKPIHAARKKMGLVANTSLDDTAPPSLAFATVAMGAFRGLIVDILWMRADTLKQEGKFFDAKQLAEWITTLQPRFAAVWDFHAWNMAYNISVAIPNTQPEERWRWVRNGYELLRDRGIEMNPRSIMLYRSLAWIFQHKIGGVSDDSHRYYKRELALSMRDLLGEDPSNAYFESLVQQSDAMEKILADEKTSLFLNELKEADETFSDKKKLVANYLTLRKAPGRFKEEAFDVVDRYRGTEALDNFDLFAKAWQLRHVWKFDIDFMNELNQAYGPVRIDDPNDRLPLNWEHPAAHSMYWAAMGLKEAGRPDQYRVDEKNTDRVVFHSLQMMFRSGKVVLYDIPDQRPTIHSVPDLRMFQSCDEFWKKIIEKYDSFGPYGNPKAVKGGHKNFLENAVMLFYQAGHEQYASKIYKRLQTEHRYNPQGVERAEYRVPMVTFLRSRLKDELQGVGIQDAVEFIISTLMKSYLYYAIHEDDDAASQENLAQEIYDIYQKNMGIDEPGRMGLPPMDWFRYQAFAGFLNDPMYPEHMRMSLIGRIQVERPDLFEKLRKQEIQFIEKMEKQRQEQER